VKALVPTNLYLQTQDKSQHSTVLLHHNYTRFIGHEARHYSSGLTNNIHKSASYSDLKYYGTTIVMVVLNVGIFNFIFHMT